MLKRIVHSLAQKPIVFNLLRRILEFNHRGEKNVISKEIDTYNRILDLGCGTGEFCREFASGGYVGIDISEIYIEYAQKRFPDYKFELMDARDLKFSDAYFDVVLIAGVLHHCESEITKSILGEVKRVLSSDGKVIVWEDVPTRGKMNIIGKAIQKLDEGEHILNAADYLKLFKDVFKIIKTYPMHSGFCDYQVFVLKK